MNKVGKFLYTMWKDESAQGATEYILLLVAVVALVMIFKKQILSQIETVTTSLGTQINEAAQPK